MLLLSETIRHRLLFFFFLMAVLQIHQDLGINCSVDKHNNGIYKGIPLHTEKLVGKNGNIQDLYR